MGRQAFEHEHAVSFEYETKKDVGPPILTLVIGTDLKGKGWSETPAGKSLMDAVDAYMCGPNCRVRRVDVYPIGRLHAARS